MTPEQIPPGQPSAAPAATGGVSPETARFAQLPDGSNLSFPLETSDEDMDRQVRKHLGLPDPIDPAIEQHAFLAAVQTLGQVRDALTIAVQMMQGMMQYNAQCHAELMQAIGTVPQALAVIPQAIADNNAGNMQLGQQLAEIGRALVKSTTAVAKTNEQLAVVTAAPRIKKLIYEKDGDKRPAELHETVKLGG